MATCVGYTQGGGEQPTYKDVCSGRSGHTEAVLVLFRPAEVSFASLCAKLMETIDPTLLNQVGRDYGTQYRHGVYPHSPEQMRTAQACVARVQADLPAGRRCHMEVLQAKTFWPAEEFHRAPQPHRTPRSRTPPPGPATRTPRADAACCDAACAEQYLQKGGKLGNSQSAAKGCRDSVRCYG